ncbi:LysR substrate-binding domain-containing protein [Teichococcus aestuarii]|uniref:Transcriptional regulator n=1 Tax=Teichococcus aestuarii TaxID=568898 RepID=A0A2U1V463_9PROT|nr:LysR substrate-binding domain-containing protein [Pseudoroseomonas aestuarii]PWC28673.1 transcriptional regulator [Pseudoroseomonas aestuarii]
MTYRRLPSLSALRCFEAAARHGSLSRAAAELHVTPGAVSRQVRALEEELRVALFLRGPGGVTPTPAGETLFAAARAGLDRLAEGVAQATAPAPRQALTVGAYALFASRWLIPRWPRLQARHPGLDITLVTTADPLALSPGRFDAVIAVAGPAARPGLLVQPLVPIETVPVCAPALAGPQGFRWEGKPLLHSRQRPRDWARWLAAAGVEGPDPRQGAAFESIGLAIDAAASGLGVALAIRALIGPDLEAGRVVVPVPFARRSAHGFVLLCEAARAAEAGLAAFRHWLAEEAGMPPA